MTPEQYAQSLESKGNAHDPYSDPRHVAAAIDARAQAWSEHIDERAAELLPHIDAVTASRVLRALLNASTDDDRYSAIDDAARAAGIDVHAAIELADAHELFTTSPGFIDADNSLQRTAAPFDPTQHRPRTSGPLGVAVRGDRHLTYVVDGDGNRMSTDEAIERANAWQAIASVDGVVLALLGTETSSWAEVLHAREADAVTHGMGASMVGRDSTRGVKANGGHRTATYPRRSTSMPETTNAGKDVMRSKMWSGQSDHDATTVGAWPFTSARVVKRYGASMRVRVGLRLVSRRYGAHEYPAIDGVRQFGPMMHRTMTVPVMRTAKVVGHGRWVMPSMPKVSARTGAVKGRTVVVDVVDVVDACNRARQFATDGLKLNESESAAYRLPDGRRVTVKVEPEHKRYRVTVATSTTAADGSTSTTRKATTVRKVDAVVAAIRNRTR